MARRDDREYRAIFEGGATQPAAGVPAARFPARWGGAAGVPAARFPARWGGAAGVPAARFPARWDGAGMHRRPNGVPSAAAALGTPNAAGLAPRAAKRHVVARRVHASDPMKPLA